MAIARDDATGVYITGYTNSSSGIATVGAYDTTFNGPAASQDAFAAKYTDTRAAFTLVYATYLGGYSNDVGYGIVVDSFGQAYVAGETYSPDFPMVSADDSVQSKGEAFLSRLNAAGTQLTYSSFWGGAENDSGRGLAKDFANDVYLVGYTNSPKDGFSLGPIKPYRDYSGGADAFVTKFSIPVANTDYSLTVNFQGSGSGLVTSIPEGIGQTADCKITNGVLDPPSADCNASYPTGTVVTLTAVAEANSRFIGWSGACTGTSTCQVTMTQAQSVNANFAPLRTLTVTKTGSGSGTVTSSPAGIDCGADCSEGYPQNAQVVLTATPAAGAAFTDWSGGVCSGTASTCTFIMDTDKTVSANFKVPEFALTVLKTGTGTGTVASNPDGINCGADCTKNYALGTVVTLTATPNAGFAFSNWGGACTGTSTTCLVTMDQAKEVTANFTVNYLLTVTKDGTGTGTVTAEGGGINCGSDCTESYPANTVLNLAAEASAGSTFAGWSGACTGLGTCVVTMTAAQNVKATFNLGEANLPDLVVSTLASPAPGQTNSSSALTFSLNVTNQGSAAAGSFGVGLYLSADQTIDPATDGEIDECLLMNLNVGATSPVCTKTITLPTIFTAGSYSSLGAYADPENLIAESTETNNSRATAIATVTYNRNPLTVTKAGTGGGTVISAPAGIVCGSACTAALLSTSVDTATLTLTAAPNTGSTFTGWSGGCSGAEDCVVTMNAAKTVTATFAASTCPASSGDVNGDGSVNALDAVAVTNHILGIQTSPNTDVNCDGGVNALDLVFVINKVLGL